MDTPAQALATQLAEARRVQGLSVEQAAERTGLTVDQYVDAERAVGRVDEGWLQSVLAELKAGGPVSPRRIEGGS